jgi:hypothetical protein
MKKITFKKYKSILVALLLSSNIYAGHVSNVSSSTIATYNLQYKVISFFAELFSDNHG